MWPAGRLTSWTRWAAPRSARTALSRPRSPRQADRPRHDDQDWIGAAPRVLTVSRGPVRGIGGFPAEHPVQGAPGGFGPAGVFGPRRWRGGVLGLGLGRRGGGLGVPLGVVLADVQVEERPGGVPEPAER